MFIVSQILLNQTKVCETKNISTYAIALGLTTYAIIYVYMLFYNNENMGPFNNYIFYIIGIDLFLSAFYSYYKTDNNNNKQRINSYTKTSEKPEKLNNESFNNALDNDSDDDNSDDDDDDDDVFEDDTLVENDSNLKNDLEQMTDLNDHTADLNDHTSEQNNEQNDEQNDKQNDEQNDEPNDEPHDDKLNHKNELETKPQEDFNVLSLSDQDIKSDSEVEINQKMLLDNNSEPIEQTETKRRRGRPNKVMLI
jgi:hypothetical protein